MIGDIVLPTSIIALAAWRPVNLNRFVVNRFKPDRWGTFRRPRIGTGDNDSAGVSHSSQGSSKVKDPNQQSDQPGC